MNVVPVAKQSQDEQEGRDDQQAQGFGRIDGVPRTLGRGIVVGGKIGHAGIVALLAVLNYGVIHACVAIQPSNRAFWSVRTRP
jgi:hypothetical protein